MCSSASSEWHVETCIQSSYMSHMQQLQYPLYHCVCITPVNDKLRHLFATEVYLASDAIQEQMLDFSNRLYQNIIHPMFLLHQIFLQVPIYQMVCRSFLQMTSNLDSAY
jgi:hypothetical protein